MRPQLEELEARALPSRSTVPDTVAPPPSSPPANTSPPSDRGQTTTTATSSGKGVVAQPDFVAVAPLGATPNASSGTVYYTASQIRQAYGINPLSQTGAGETIAIVDAYVDPNIASDLATFDSQMGLQAPPSLQVVKMNGASQVNSGWALETSLDVEWAHAVAPGANILLVEAPSSSLTALNNAVSYAGQHANVVSMSWGSGEFSGETSNDSVFTHPGVTYIASSGDSGTVEYPSVSPNVLAIGGTSLYLNSANNWSSETAWSSSGGGKSAYETKPLFQQSLNFGSMRTTPDVSYNANPSTGFLVYDSVPYYGQAGWWDVGGTSAGAPQWAGIVALADQAHGTSLSTAQVQTAVYNILKAGTAAQYFHDVTSGSNGSYSAGTGYDLVTGIGSPIVNNLVPAL